MSMPNVSSDTFEARSKEMEMKTKKKMIRNKYKCYKYIINTTS